MPSATITSKGQITIPKVVRQALKVRTGDRLDFVIESGGRVLLRPGIADVTELKGILHRPDRPPVSVEDMNAAIARQGRPKPVARQRRQKPR
jgi:AbrB family looped-hinge helix DNA binding protein